MAPRDFGVLVPFRQRQISVTVPCTTHHNRDSFQCSIATLTVLFSTGFQQPLERASVKNPQCAKNMWFRLNPVAQRLPRTFGLSSSA